jgi:hypothetical protein
VPMRAARVDANQRAVVQALRGYGCSVLHLHMVGGGCHDLLIATPPDTNGWRRLGLVEIKTPTAAKRKDQDKTPDQIKFWAEWHGAPMALVDGADAALRFARLLAFEPEKVT